MTSGTTFLATVITTDRAEDVVSLPMDTDERVKRLQEIAEGSDQLFKYHRCIIPVSSFHEWKNKKHTYVMYVLMLGYLNNIFKPKHALVNAT